MSTPPINDGGHAFPVLHSIDGNWVREPLAQYCGMTLRDYFAGQALAGMVSNHSLVDNFSNHAGVAKEAYWLADEMISARNK